MKGYLALENGRVFEGELFGATCTDKICEVVFTTTINGYIETLTDPSYYGQSVVMTFPLIGNYGVIPEDMESGAVQVSGLIVKQLCEEGYSNFRSKLSLDEFLKNSGVVGLKGVDTREITRLIRDKGTMNGVITDNLNKVDFSKLKKYRVCDAIVSVGAKCVNGSKSKDKPTVALFDFGAKDNIKRELESRGLNVVLVPPLTSVSELNKLKVDAVLLSNGAGDPKENEAVIANVKSVIESDIFVMGICLGHQLMALASGFDTEKMRFGHRGGNQPVKKLSSGEVFITSQNHGYAVVKSSINRAIGECSYENLNDGTVEGIEYNNGNFSVQFHPEGAAGPKDTEFLFDRLAEVAKKKYATR